MSAPAGYYNLYKRHPAKGGGAPFFLAVGHVLEPAPLSLRIASCVITRFHVTIKKRSRNPALSSFPPRHFTNHAQLSHASLRPRGSAASAGN